MPVVETCAVCGLELDFFPQYKGGKGEYFHRFSSKNPGKYKFIHLAVPQLEDPSLTDGSDLSREDSREGTTFNTGGKVEPRASITPKDGMSYRAIESEFKENTDVRMVAHFLKAIFEAR